MDNKEKMEYIATHYSKLMHSVANSILNDYHEAEDACQESYLKLYAVIDKLEDVTSVRTRAYCVTTARNMALDMAKKKAKLIPREEFPETDDEKNSFEEEIANTEEIIREINALPEKYRNVIRMRCFEEKTPEETAALLNSNVDTVNSRLLRARKLLKSRWVSIACLLCMLVILAAGAAHIGMLQQSTVYYDTVPMAAEETAADAAMDGENAGEIQLSDSELYQELDEIALKEVPGAAEDDITDRQILEEDTGFCYEVSILYRGQLHLVRLDLTGKLLSHEIPGISGSDQE